MGKVTEHTKNAVAGAGKAGVASGVKEIAAAGGGEMLRRVGIHISTQGGVFMAAERAHAMGANAFQIFSSSPRMWRAPRVDPAHAARLAELRERYDIGPVAIHASYLINLCSQNEEVREKSVEALHGELERGLALGAEYLVLHPGSWKGLTRETGLALAAESIERAAAGLELAGRLTVLIENTAGAEHSLGGSLEQVAELVGRLEPHLPTAVCLDTCHMHVAGYDLVSEEGWQQTVGQIEQTVGSERVRVWHCNDAKAARGSKLDRHEHIGLGTIGIEPFRRLLHEPCFAHAAFLAETPVDEQRDEAGNVAVLRELAATS